MRIVCIALAVMLGGCSVVDRPAISALRPLDQRNGWQYFEFRAETAVGYERDSRSAERTRMDWLDTWIRQNGYDPAGVEVVDRRYVKRNSGLLADRGDLYYTVRVPQPRAAETPEESDGQERPAPRAAAPESDASGSTKERRRAMIDKCVASGVFERVEFGGVPKIWVGPGFYALPFDAKQAFVGVVYAYSFDGDNYSDAVILRDAHSGRQVGSYALPLRLRMKR